MVPIREPLAGDLASTRQALRADCGRCAGLCCVAPAFAASADFATDKPAGQPCRNLLADFNCRIHDRLRQRGFPGCAVFDCFGAGQHVTQTTFAGQDWRRTPTIATSMFAVFGVMRQLRELMWYLAECRTLAPGSALAAEVERAWHRTEHLTEASAEELAAFDATAYRSEVGVLLTRVSEEVRAAVDSPAADRKGADLIGANLRGANLRGASLRGAYLVGADLRGADLRMTDLLGADLRAADIRGANLTGSIFVTQPQVEAAKGDAATTIPPALTRPTHWQRLQPRSTTRRA